MVSQEARDISRAKAWLVLLLTTFASAQAILLADGMLGNQLTPQRASAILTVSIFLGILSSVPFWRAMLRSKHEPKLGGSRLGRIGLITLWSWTLSVWVQLFIVTWLRPIYDWDGLYYHIPAIHGWIQAGYISWVNAGADLPYVNGYPMGMEALSFLGTVLLATDRLLDAGNLLFWPVGALALYVVARRLGSAKGWSLATAAALSGIPLFVAQSTTAYVDPGFTCAMMALFAASLEMIRRPSAAHALLLGVSSALVIATKGLGIPFVFFIFVSVLIFGSAGRPASARNALLQALPIAAILTLLLGGGWMLRNLLETGNPIYPVGLQVAGWTIFDGIDARAHTLLNLPSWLADQPPVMRTLVSWAQPNAPIIHYGATSGLGFIWLTAGLPAILALLIDNAQRHGRRILRVARLNQARPLLFLLTVGAFLFFWQPGSWWARFTLWIHVLGLPCFALVMTRSYRIAGPSSRWAMGSLCALLFGVVLGESVLAVRGQWEDGLLDPVEMSYRSSVEYVFPGLVSTPGFEELLGQERVARSTWSHWGMLMGGVLAQPLGAREVEVVSADVDFSALYDLHRRGYEVILWDVGAAGPCPGSLQRVGNKLGEFSDRPGLNFELWQLDVAALNAVAR